MLLRKYIHILIALKRHLRGELKVPELQIIKQFLQPTDICLDIGAHGGSWSRPLAGIVKEGRVYSFEALPYYADILRKTFKLLGFRNIKVVNKAVTDREGRIAIVWKDSAGKRLTGKTHIQGTHENTNHLIWVDGIRLDTFVSTSEKEKIKFIKIDVEGAEMQVLKGAEALMNQHRPIVFCELDERWTSRFEYKPYHIFELFSTKGYRAFIINKDLTLSPIAHSTYRNKGDVLFIPAEMKLPEHLRPINENSTLQ